MSCFSKISEEDQNDIISRFLGLSTKDEQDLHLQMLIDVHEVKKRRPRKLENSRENSHSYKYHALVGNLRVEVCLKAFLALHSVTIKRVKRIRNLKATGKSPKDQRGKHVKKCVPAEIRALVTQHIDSFPVKISHYSGKTVKYLDARLNIKTMFDLFKKKHANINISYSFYANVFNDNFKLSFGRPQIDCCCVCEELNVKLKSPHLNEAAKKCAAAELMVHKRKAKKFYNKLKEEVENKNEPHVLALTFDYMQNIQLPCIPVQETFYLRQLTTNVFCIHNVKENTAFMYVYHEGVAKKGPNEVSSFLYDYLKSVPEHYTDLHIYSDNCAGQNKNHALSRFLLFLAESKRFNKIEQYFPIRGHSFLPCDRDFSMVKKELKRHDRIYDIHEVTGLIISSSKSNKFMVKEVDSDDILDFKNWWPTFYKKNAISDETKNRSVAKDKKINFMISNLLHLTYDSNQPCYIFGRPYIESPVVHSFFLKQTGRPTNLLLTENKAYPQGLVPIKKTKINDLKKLMPYVPQDFKGFYEKILTWPTVDGEDIDE